MKPLQILLAGPHTLVRAGIGALIEAIDGVEVIGETGDAGEALRLIKELQPDIVLLDIGMPGMSEIEVLEKSARQFPGVHIIILGAEQSRESASQALRAGAAGYLPKSASRTELVDAMATVARGEIHVSQGLKQMLVERDKERDLLTRLTGRQREVLVLIVDGYATKEIARSLNISAKTVETYRAQLMERLDVHDVPGLVRFAIRMRLIDLA